MFDIFNFLKKDINCAKIYYEELEYYYNSYETCNNSNKKKIKEIKEILKDKSNYMIETILVVLIGTFLIALVANQVSTANFKEMNKIDGTLDGILWGSIYISIFFLLVYFNEILKILRDSYNYNIRLIYTSLIIVPFFTTIFFNYNKPSVDKLTFYSFILSPSMIVSFFFILVIHEVIELIHLKRKLLLKEKPLNSNIESIEQL